MLKGMKELVFTGAVGIRYNKRAYGMRRRTAAPDAGRPKLGTTLVSSCHANPDRPTGPI